MSFNEAQFARPIPGIICWLMLLCSQPQSIVASMQKNKSERSLFVAGKPTAFLFFCRYCRVSVCTNPLNHTASNKTVPVGWGAFWEMKEVSDFGGEGGGCSWLADKVNLSLIHRARQSLCLVLFCFFLQVPSQSCLVYHLINA